MRLSFLRLVWFKWWICLICLNKIILFLFSTFLKSQYKSKPSSTYYIIFYSKFCSVLMRRSISFFGGESRLIEEQRRRKEKKTVMLLVWVVIVFILAWLPLNSLSVLLDLNLYKTIFRYFEMFNVCEVHIKVNTGTWYGTDIFICFPISLCIENKLDNVMTVCQLGCLPQWRWLPVPGLFLLVSHHQPPQRPRQSHPLRVLQWGLC